MTPSVQQGESAQFDKSWYEVYAMTGAGIITSLAAVFIGIIITETARAVDTVESAEKIPLWLCATIFIIGAIVILFSATFTIRSISVRYAEAREQLTGAEEVPLKFPKYSPPVLLGCYIIFFVLFPCFGLKIQSVIPWTGIGIWIAWFLSIYVFLVKWRWPLVTRS